jgi:DNA-binding transcriptional LysR family regulator
MKLQRGDRATLRQLEFFVGVATESSFSRAADTLHVSQPALSQQIRVLERQLGAPLFHRLSSGVRLTSAGSAMLPHAQASIAAARRGVRAFHEVGAGLAGELELATVMSIAVGVLPRPLMRWHSEVPQVSVTLSEFAHRRNLEDFVAAGSADLGIGPTPPEWQGPCVDIGLERFVLVTSPHDRSFDHVRPYPGPAPAAAPRSIGTLDLRALARRDWVMFDRSHGLSEFTEGHLRASGHSTTQATVRTTQFLTAAKLASSGMGPTLLPANVVPDDLEAVVCEPAPPLTRSLSVYARSEPTGAAARFVEILRHSAPMLE